MDIKKQTGERIRELRLKNNLKQSELAEKVGIATKHQSCIETGRNFPSAELFEKYAIVFSMDVSEMLCLKPYILNKPRKEIIENIIDMVSVSSDYELNIIEKTVKSILNK